MQKSTQSSSLGGAADRGLDDARQRRVVHELLERGLAQQELPRVAVPVAALGPWPAVGVAPRFPLPGSRFPVPVSRFPFPGSRFQVPNSRSRFRIPDSLAVIPKQHFTRQSYLVCVAAFAHEYRASLGGP